MVSSMQGEMALKRRVLDLERSCVREDTTSSNNVMARFSSGLAVWGVVELYQVVYMYVATDPPHIHSPSPHLAAAAACLVSTQTPVTAVQPYSLTLE